MKVDEGFTGFMSYQKFEHTMESKKAAMRNCFLTKIEKSFKIYLEIFGISQISNGLINRHQIVQLFSN